MVSVNISCPCCQSDQVYHHGHNPKDHDKYKPITSAEIQDCINRRGKSIRSTLKLSDRTPAP
ncbi:hypothetical protein JFY74_02515 [Pectobacterium carotovorum]|nr:hypothetical protein JFY74_02515 [Pectobacterium carotovorum]